MRTFLTIWFGQLISALGTGMTQFAVGIWVFQQTGDVMEFALVLCASYLPQILLSPLAGAITDRYDRRLIMILSDAASGVCTLAILGLLLTTELQVWFVYPLAAALSLVNTFQQPAYHASIVLLVPRAHLGRMNGLVQMAAGIARILPPALAGILFARAGLAGVLWVDLATFLAAFLTLLVVRIPRPARPSVQEQTPRTVREDIGELWTWLQGRPGLLGILALTAGIAFLGGLVETVTTPMILAFASEEELGVTLSLASTGLLLGGVVAAAVGAPRRRIRGVLAGTLVVGIAVAAEGLRPSLLLIGASKFVILFSLSIVSVCASTLWQEKVPPALQGRASAFRSQVAGAAMLVGLVLAGPLGDHVFVPALETGGPLAGWLGPWFGTGPGRGLGLLATISGVTYVLFVLLMSRLPSLRHVDELPDAGEEADEEAGEEAGEEAEPIPA